MKSFIALTLAAVLSSGAFAQQQSNSMPAAPGTQPAPPAQDSTMEQTAPSSAQTSSLESIFDKLNVSHTGKLTKAEAQAHPTVAANFDAADTNHDGVLTKDEFLAAFRPAQ
jgi:uncharacterized protein YdeI (BOF family)